MSKNYLAHRIIFDGKEYAMSIAKFSDDDRKVEIVPYEKEIASTIFINGTIKIEKTPEGVFRIC